MVKSEAHKKLMREKYQKDEKWRDEQKERMKKKGACEICKCEVVLYAMKRHQRTSNHITKVLKMMKKEGLKPEDIEKINRLL